MFERAVQPDLQARILGWYDPPFGVQGNPQPSIYSISQKTIPCSFYFSVYICWPISAIFGTEYTEKICNTKVVDLPTSPTQCCCITFGKLNFWFLAYCKLVFLRQYVGDFEKSRFWCWDEDANLEMYRVTADAQSDHHWQPRRQSSAHIQRLHYHLVNCWNFSHIEHSVKLENNIQEKELYIWSA